MLGDEPIEDILNPQESRRRRPDNRDRSDRQQFRLRGIRFLLTYPQCPHEASVGLEAQLSSLGSERYLVCKELHSDGGQHLHAYVEFHSPQYFTRPDCFDFTHNGIAHHGSYEAARSSRRAAAYVAKDGDLVSRGFTPAEIEQLRQHHRPPTDFASLGKRLLSGEAIEELFREQPQLIWLKDLNKVRLIASSVRHYDPLLKDALLRNLEFYNTGVQWSFDPARPCRAPENGQYFPFIWGPPNCGKSTLLKSANAKPYKFYHTPGTVSNWVGFDSNLCDCIVFDDASKETLLAVGYSVLNALCDGDPVQLNCKGGAALCHKRLPVIIITNYSPSVLFPSDNPLACASASRFRFYYVTPTHPSMCYHPDSLPKVEVFDNIGQIPTHILDENGPTISN